MTTPNEQWFLTSLWCYHRLELQSEKSSFFLFSPILCVCVMY
jgi:hypothetical protein